jgi:hypothetical protein
MSEDGFMREMKRRRYILAFIITIALFFLGFFLGFTMDLKRVDYFDKLNSAQKLNIQSLQLQYELLKGDAVQDRCGAFKFLFDKYIIELEENRARLDSYSKQSNIIASDFENLKREYVISQINFWYISRNFQASCPNSSDFATVLYFFSNDQKCPDCGDQGTVLDYYKSVLKQSLLIFSFDETFADNEPLIKMLEQVYDVKEYPTIVVNNKAYSGFVGKQNLTKILCSQYDSDATRKEICY